MEKRAEGSLEDADFRTRDLGIKWPQRHTLLFEQVAVDMRVVCPQDVEKDASEESQDGLSEEMGSQA